MKARSIDIRDSIFFSSFYGQMHEQEDISVQSNENDENLSRFGTRAVSNI
jgi:hypothetical protein